MAKNVKYEPGWRKAYACTKPDEPDSGDPVRIGNMTGIALTDEDAAGKTTVDKGPFSARFTVKDNGGAGIGVGDAIWYHDDQTPPLDNVPTGGYYFGMAEEAITARQTAIIEVSHDPAPGGAGNPQKASGRRLWRQHSVRSSRSSCPVLGVLRSFSSRLRHFGATSPPAGSAPDARSLSAAAHSRE